jgi:Transposase and inactivated derivatives
LEGGSPWDLSLTPAFKAGEASEEWTSAVSTAYDWIRMSVHSYSRCWVHLIWGTLNREKLLNKAAAARVSGYLTEHAEKDRIYMKINYVNADHVHALIDLPTALSIEKVIQLLKGSSSHWINSNNLVTRKFAWAEAMEHFQCRNRMCHGWQDTSQIKKNIIACVRLRRS